MQKMSVIKLTIIANLGLLPEPLTKKVAGEMKSQSWNFCCNLLHRLLLTAVEQFVIELRNVVWKL